MFRDNQCNKGKCSSYGRKTQFVLINETGGISVFLCIIFTAVIFLSGFLIDTARIKTAERKVQSALNTSVRSALAGYDYSLANSYGIFGFASAENKNMTDAGQESIEYVRSEFEKYFKMNFAEKGRNYNLLSCEIESEEKTIVDAFGSLSDNGVLRNQILNYMKYRMPVLLSKNIADRFFNAGLLDKLRFSEKERDLRRTRNEIISEINNLNKEIVQVNLSKITNSSDLENMKTVLKAVAERIDNLESGITTYVTAGNEAKEEVPNSGNSTTANETGAAPGSETDIKSTSGAAPGSETDIKSTSAATSEFDATKKAINSLKDDVSNIREHLEAATIRVKDLEEHIKTYETKLKLINNEILNNIRNNTDSEEAPLSDPEFYNLKNTDSEIANSEPISSHTATLESERNRIINNIEADRLELQKLLNNGFLENLKEIKIYKPTINNSNEVSNNGLKNWTELIESLKNDMLEYSIDIKPEWLITDSDISSENIADNQSYVDMKNNMEFNKAFSSENDIELKNDGILTYLNNFLSDIKKAVESGIEKMCIVEYVMEKFSNVTEKNTTGHYFKSGEAEYILTGNSNQLKCIEAIFTKILMLRFAIDTVDYFAAGQSAHPIIRLAIAVERGFVQSIKEAYELYKGNTIALCPSLESKKDIFGINYSDMLRIFLLLQNEERQLNNIKQLIQVNIKQADPKFRLIDYHTALKAKAGVKIKLWFIPLLKLDKAGVKGFNNSYYTIVKDTYTSY